MKQRPEQRGWKVEERVDQTVSDDPLRWKDGTEVISEGRGVWSKLDEYGDGFFIEEVWRFPEPPGDEPPDIHFHVTLGDIPTGIESAILPSLEQAMDFAEQELMISDLEFIGEDMDPQGVLWAEAEAISETSRAAVQELAARLAVMRNGILASLREKRKR